MSINFEICKKCRKKIPKSQKIIHESNCKSLQNNLPKNNNINNINKDDSLKYNISKSGKNYENDLQLIFSLENGFNENLSKKEEELLNLDGILNIRNIQSNHSIHYDRNEVHSFYRENSISFYNFSSYNNYANEILNDLVPIKIKDKNAKPKEECIICLEKYKIGESYIILPCIHLFHEDCIKKWIRKKNKCPVCVSEIKINNMNIIK